MSGANNPSNNYLLSKLSSAEYQRLSDRLEPVQLSLNQILIEANRDCEAVYFPTEGIVSLMSIMKDGSTTEIGLIGTEGMVGTFPFIGKGVSNSRAFVQLKGSAMRLDIKTLQAEFNRGETLQKLILSYALSLFEQVSQCAACNNQHTVKQRTARWLLMIDDRTDTKTFSMTQLLISRMLGVRRPGVTEVAGDIQRLGIISYHRGKITILDRPALETIACECYQKLKIV